MLKKGVRRNRLNVYLSFWRVPSESIFSFWAGGFIYIALAWRHRFSLSKILHPEFGTRFVPSVHLDISLQNWYSLPLFPLTEEGATSALEFWPIVSPLSSSSPGRFFRTTISFTRSQNANILRLSFWPGFVTSTARNWPRFLFLT